MAKATGAGRDLARLGSGGFGQETVDQMVGRELRVSALGELIKLARDADERGDGDPHGDAADARPTQPSTRPPPPMRTAAKTQR